jgi:hypothetical protein
MTNHALARTDLKPLQVYLFVMLLVLAVQAAMLFTMGRAPICPCGTVKLWHGLAQSRESSQHIIDWYTPSHVVHGLLFYFVIWLLLPDKPWALRLTIAVMVEGLWEIVENSDFIINRYRATGASQNYAGDSIVNSVSDTVTMAVGFVLAHRLPVVLSIALAVALEGIAALWIRDNLILNIVMLIHPFEAISRWQAALVP